MDDLEARFLSLETAGREQLERGKSPLKLLRFLDARYVGQSYELTVPYSPDFRVVRSSLDSSHAERYGFADSDAEIEIVAVRVTAIDPSATSDRLSEYTVAEHGVPVSSRSVYFSGKWRDTPIYHRSRLAQGQAVTGPIIIEQFDSTIVVNPQQECRTDHFGFLHIYKKEAAL
ncbi:hypothetical protein ACQCSU_21175 [Pseudarthrobacter sp. O4]|uniref:hypothetical protein n=1 Tax=Pseudarthrobacter sp. O4 TaxID=3418417 RepID=UPI003CF915AE